MSNYAIYHIHTDLSNAFTVMDSVTKFTQYVDKAKEFGMTSMCFSEHGNMLEWLKKKEYIEKNGMKYIHAVESYVTESLDDKKRDNYHVVLIAKNSDGVKELLKMHSHDTAFNKEDGHFYYNPRITYDELKATSDNIIICSACLGGIINNAPPEMAIDFIKFMSENKHRCFLEIQHHNVKDQIEYNQKLYKVSEKTGIPLIAGTDTHCLDDFHVEGRALYQKRKGVKFDSESNLDFTMKSYDELVFAYEEQNSLPREVYMQAIENTNVMADMVESFDVDRSHKYPQIYENGEEIFMNKIKNGIKDRNLPKTKEYAERIKKEVDAMKTSNSINYILLEELVKKEMARQGVFPAPSRGSSSGSLVNYILGITDIDSIRFRMNFERFLNPYRVSLMDIDSDWSPLDRPKVKAFLYSIPNVYCAEIVTFNTVALKGAIRDIGGALGIPLAEIDVVAKNIEDREEQYREQYPELFKYVDLINGVIVSVGSHPAGTIVSPIPLTDSIGTFVLDKNDYPVSQLNMKEVDSLNFVKLDILGLANIGVINLSCEMAGIKRLDANTMDYEDDNVWNHIIENKNNIFQFESEFAHRYLTDCLRPEVIKKMREKNPNLMRLDIMSMANGAIRPAGDSYREALSNGEFKDNGHEALNKFLAPTNGFLVYQEQIIEFLNQFCGFTMGASDLVRRNFSKKIGTEKDIPKIKQGFIETMTSKYNSTIEEAEEIIESFLKVIEDASDYLFSLNHATPYSIIGYMTAYMRYYYPLEFLCASLMVNEGKKEKMAETTQYIKAFTDIKLKHIEFGKSRADYSINKKDNAIYKGMSSIKYLNKQVSEELFVLSQENEYDCFLSLLVDIKTKTSLDARQLRILTTLGFFKRFGNNKYLLNIIEIFDNLYYVKQLNDKKINELGLDKDVIMLYTNKRTEKLFKDIDTYGLVNHLINDLENGKLGAKEQIQKEHEYLGYVEFKTDKAPKSLYAVIEFKTYNNPKTPYLQLYRLNDGEITKAKITSGKLFAENPFKQFDILNIKDSKERYKKRNIGGEWIEIDELETILTDWSVY